MPSHRSQHNCESIKREIIAIIRELKDPRLIEDFISVLKISSSDDCSHFDVFVSALGGIEKAIKATACLQAAEGVIRKKLGEKCRVRYIPNLKFIATDALEYGMNISKKIDEVIHSHPQKNSRIEREKEKKTVSLRETVQKIRSSDFFCIITHDYPDGDAIGSSVALCRILQRMGKHAQVRFETAIPKKFEFLLNYIQIQNFEPKTYISVDLADTNLLHDDLKTFSEKIDICIDHHKSNKNYANLRLIDTFAAASCEVIFDLSVALGYNIDMETATCLYVGIATDTGGFMYSNTSSKTHRIVSNLMEKNISADKINENIFIVEPQKKFKLKRIAYNNLNFSFKNKVAISQITIEEMGKIGVLDSELDGLASIPIQIEGIKIGAVIREKSNNICKVSVRTNAEIDANEFCSIFGGGGHKKAGGFIISVNATTARKKIIEAIKSFTGWQE